MWKRPTSEQSCPVISEYSWTVHLLCLMFQQYTVWPTRCLKPFVCPTNYRRLAWAATTENKYTTPLSISTGRSETKASSARFKYVRHRIFTASSHKSYISKNHHCACRPTLDFSGLLGAVACNEICDICRVHSFNGLSFRETDGTITTCKLTRTGTGGRETHPWLSWLSLVIRSLKRPLV